MSEAQSPGAPGRVVFVGAVHEAEPALAALLAGPATVAGVVTAPADPSLRPSGYVDLEPLAAAHGAPVRRCTDINAGPEVAYIRHLAPDLIVVVGWTRLLHAELLAIPPRGCVGFHASLLPRYRGRAPVNWAILRGEEVTGNTMMYLDPGTDTGDIVDQRRVPIGLDDTCATVYAAVAQAGAAMLTDQLPALLAGSARRRPQTADGGEVLRKRTPHMGITDWDRPARAVHDWIRALTRPYPGAFGFQAGRKVMLWASGGPGPYCGGRPGEVLGYAGDAVRIATAGGSVLVTAMSAEGADPEPAAAWASRAGLRPGDEFDAVDAATAAWALGLGPKPEAAEAPARSG
jgi:methionyl-tRNA formyltransferase